MSTHVRTRSASAVLAASLLLNIVFVSCSADAVTAPATTLAQDPGVVAQLAAIVERLDSIEAKTDRIDQNTADGVETIIAALSDPDGSFLDALSLSIDGSLSGSMEVCANLEAGLGLGLEYGVGAEGKALARVGPNVLEALAMAGGEAKVEGALKGSGSVDGYLSLALCGAAEASLEGGVDVLALVEQIRSSVGGLGMDGSRLQSLASGITTPVPDNYSAAISQIRSTLPAGGVTLTAFDNPISFLSSSPAILEFGVQNRCSSALFSGLPTLADAQQELCALSIPSASDYIGILNGLNGLPSTVSSLSSGLSSVCNTVSSILPRGSFGIPRRTITIPPQTILFWDPTTYTTFPAMSFNLFNGLPQPTC